MLPDGERIRTVGQLVSQPPFINFPNFQSEQDSLGQEPVHSTDIPSYKMTQFSAKSMQKQHRCSQCGNQELHLSEERDFIPTISRNIIF